MMITYLLAAIRRCEPWAGLLSAAFLGSMLAYSVWQVVAAPQAISLPALRVVDRAIAPPSVAQQGNPVEQIIRRQLYGEVMLETQPVEPIVEDAPDTGLRLFLLGIFASDGAGAAVISQSNSGGQIFRSGDDVFGQASVARIEQDRVILQRNGRYETLRFEELKNSGLLLPNQIGGSNELPEGMEGIIDGVEGIIIDDSVEPQGEVEAPLDRADDLPVESEPEASAASAVNFVERIRQQAQQNPQALLQRFGLEQSAGGYRVSRRARELLSIGMRPGDLVVAVNDVSVGDVAQDQALLESVIASGDIKLDIQRGSRRFTLYIRIPKF